MAMSTSGTTTISAVKARQNFGKVLNRAYYSKERFVVERAGLPMVEITPIPESKRRDPGLSNFSKLRKQMQSTSADVPPKEAKALIDKAIKEVRAKNPDR